jgi:hypothetical protein
MSLRTEVRNAESRPRLVVLFLSRLLIRMAVAIGAWQFNRAGRRLRYRVFAGLALTGAVYLLASTLGVIVKVFHGEPERPSQSIMTRRVHNLDGEASTTRPEMAREL